MLLDLIGYHALRHFILEWLFLDVQAYYLTKQSGLVNLNYVAMYKLMSGCKPK
jgi:hypothetical protein